MKHVIIKNAAKVLNTYKTIAIENICKNYRKFYLFLYLGTEGTLTSIRLSATLYLVDKIRTAFR